jgi:hypothetical protein
MDIADDWHAGSRPEHPASIEKVNTPQPDRSSAV